MKLRADEIRFVTPHFNPLRYRRQRETYYQWVETLPSYVRDNLLCYELVFDDQEPEIENSVVIRTTSDLGFMWQKEALINRALRDCTRANYFSWLDHDMVFPDDEWYTDAVAKLQTGKKFCQLFSKIDYLDPTGVDLTVYSMQIKDRGNPGGMWLGDRAYLERLGGMPQMTIVGSGDRVLFMGVCSNELFTKYKFYRYYLGANPYSKSVRKWFVNARIQNGRKNVCTYLDRHIKHLYHGKVSNRQYKTRESKLIRLGFDPETDIQLNADGILEFTGYNLGLQEWVKEYFNDRKEDE